MNTVNLNKKHRYFNYLLQDVEGNIYAQTGLSGNQLGNRLAFIIKITEEQRSRGWVVEDEIINQQCVSSSSPYRTSLRTFKKNIFKNGGKMIGVAKANCKNIKEIK
jgi:hypothetical protein